MTDSISLQTMQRPTYTIVGVDAERVRLHRHDTRTAEEIEIATFRRGLKAGIIQESAAAPICLGPQRTSRRFRPWKSAKKARKSARK